MCKKAKSTTAAMVIRLFLIVAGVLFVMRHVWIDLFTIAYRDTEAGHIFLVPIVFLWLVWNRRHRIAELTGANNIVGAGMIAASLVIHEVSLRYEFVAGWHFSAVLCLFGGFVLAAGLSCLTRFASAAAVLVLLVPVPGFIRQQISIPLQLFSASTTEAVLSSFGFQIQRAGCILQMNETTVAIAEACNGMRMLFAVLLVVYATAFSLPIGRGTRCTLLLASPVAVLVLNFLRVLITVAMFGLCDEPLAQAVHDINGWLIPLILMAAAFLVSERQRGESNSVSMTSDSVTSEYQPVAAGLGTCMLLLVPIMHLDQPTTANAEDLRRHRAVVTASVNSIPFSVADWLGTDKTLHQEEIELLHPVNSLRREFRRLDTEESLSMTVIVCEHARDLVGHEPGICLIGQGWETSQQEQIAWRFDETTVRGTNYRFRFPSAPELETQVASILVTPGRKTSGDAAVVAAAASDFTRANFGAAQIILMMPRAVEPEEWQQITRDFVAEVLPMTTQFMLCAGNP